MGQGFALRNCLLIGAALSVLMTGCVEIFITAPEGASVSVYKDQLGRERITVDAAATSSGSSEASEALEDRASESPQPFSEEATPPQPLGEDTSSTDVQPETAEDAPAPESVASSESTTLEQWITQGNASAEEDRVIITPNEEAQLGAAWSTQPVNLEEDIDLTFAVYSGDNSDNEYAGGDGMVFVMTSVLPTQPGEGGGGMGYGNLSAESLGLELDTYPDPDRSEEDHLALNLRGQVTGEGGSPVTLGELEDGQEHLLRIVWRSEAQTLEVYFGEAQTPQLTYQSDLANDLFGGGSELYYGFTGSTGGATNLQYVRPLQP